MGPYKCPDCGAWWAGFEHRCQPTTTAPNTTITVTQPPCCACSPDLCPPNANHFGHSYCQRHSGGWRIGTVTFTNS